MSTQRIKRTTGFSSSFSTLIFRVIDLSLSHKLHLLIAVVSVILEALFQLMIPGLLGRAVDQAGRVLGVRSDRFSLRGYVGVEHFFARWRRHRT